MFTDTDSLVYEIKTDGVYKDFYKDKYLFGFSDYSTDSKFFNPITEKIIGKMKDEYKGKIISEFVGLKSKMYSLIDVDDEETNKAKGVNIKIRHKEFLDILIIGTYEVCKISLSCFDDKRYILDDGINWFTYFHKE